MEKSAKAYRKYSILFFVTTLRLSACLPAISMNSTMRINLWRPQFFTAHPPFFFAGHVSLTCLSESTNTFPLILEFIWFNALYLHPFIPDASWINMDIFYIITTLLCYKSFQIVYRIILSRKSVSRLDLDKNFKWLLFEINFTWNPLSISKFRNDHFF